MRKSALIMIAVAAAFGLMAIFVAHSWPNRQAQARPLHFGNELIRTATLGGVIAASGLASCSDIRCVHLEAISSDAGDVGAGSSVS